MYDKICQTCGTRLSRFLETGMLNCPDCYKYFSNEVLEVVDKIHGSTLHKGKQPRIAKNDKLLMERYRFLISEKEKAGLESRFTDMVKLSKEINVLYEQLKDRGLL